MSYVRVKRRKKIAAPRRRRGALGGLLDDIFGTGGASQAIENANDSACAAQADQDTQTIDAAAYDLAQNWTPTGTFTTDQMNALIDKILSLRTSAYQAVMQAKQSAPQTQQDLLDQMAGNLSGATSQLLAYMDAVKQAQAAGTYVSAPGMKDYVLKEYTDASSALHAASMVSCQLPWWAGMLIAVSQAAVALASAAKAIAGVVIQLGEKVVKAAEGALDLVAVVEQIAPYAAVGLAAWWLFLREKRKRSA